jgi:predicted N-acetyltransferase YhbS
MARRPAGPQPGDLRQTDLVRIVPERRRDEAAVERLIDAAFGPDRFGKTVYSLREGVKPIRELGFVAIDETGTMVASLRFWPILIGGRWSAVLLGPLAVEPRLRGKGYGKALMWRGLSRCRELGVSRVILVGDPEYYNPFGFRRDLALNLQLPGWVEDRRFLALELVAGSMAGVIGLIGKPLSLPRRKARRRPRPAKPAAKRRDEARDAARKGRLKARRERRRTPRKRKPPRKKG